VLLILCLCCVFCFVLFVFVLCLVCPMLPVALDYLCPVSCVPKFASGPGLSSSCVLCAQCCQCPWIVFILCRVCPMLPLFLDCLCPVSCVPNTVSFSGLSLSYVLCANTVSFSGLYLSCILCAQYCQCLWIVFVLCLDNPETLTVLGTQDTGQRQSRDIDSIGHTRYRTNKNQRN
jgi:hypothetical protein